MGVIWFQPLLIVYNEYVNHVEGKTYIWNMRNLPSSIGSVSLSSCCSLDCAPFSTSELSTSPCLLQICKSDVKKKEFFVFLTF